jgi:hypothetical protein
MLVYSCWPLYASPVHLLSHRTVHSPSFASHDGGPCHPCAKLPHLIQHELGRAIGRLLF